MMSSLPIQRRKTTSKREIPSLLELTKMYENRNAAIFGRQESNSVCYDARRSPQIRPPRLPSIDERVREGVWQHFLDTTEEDEAGPRETATSSKDGSSSSGRHSKFARSPHADHDSSHNQVEDGNPVLFWQKLHSKEPRPFQASVTDNKRARGKDKDGSKRRERQEYSSRRMTVCDETDGTQAGRRFVRVIAKRL